MGKQILTYRKEHICQQIKYEIQQAMMDGASVLIWLILLASAEYHLPCAQHTHNPHPRLVYLPQFVVQAHTRVFTTYLHQCIMYCFVNKKLPQIGDFVQNILSPGWDIVQVTFMNIQKKDVASFYQDFSSPVAILLEKRQKNKLHEVFLCLLPLGVDIDGCIR